MIKNKKQLLAVAVKAAKTVGALMRKHLSGTKEVNSQSQYDIKLALDVRAQKIIEGILLKAFPRIAILGEEGTAGRQDEAMRWVVDPIDGTVNFTYGIPHACISIALQKRETNGSYTTVLGVVYDPFCDEIWTAILGEPARMNGKIIRVSTRKKLEQSIIAIGFSKSPEVLRDNLPIFNELVGRVRKMRMMGAAALSLVYVASGRFDGYVESGVSLWDIAAAGLILECAGGEFWRRPVPGDFAYRMISTNGLLRGTLEKVIRDAKRKPIRF